MSTLLSAAPVAATSNGTSSDLTLADRIIEIVAVILLGLSTVGTAWCAYQAAQWSASGSELARQSSDQQVESARLFGLATQKVAYDSVIVAQYAEAAANGNTRLVRFYRSSLVRPEFVPILDRWEADIRAGRAPTPLTDDADYVATQLADYQKSVAASGQFARESQEAGDTASAYVSVTILLAVTLFFAGVTTQFKYRPARALLLAAALATLAVAASQLADLPVMLG